MAGRPTTWTEARLDELAKLWKEGWSCSMIAAHFGDVTRNAVIGKVHRLDLPARRTRMGKAYVSREKKRNIKRIGREKKRFKVRIIKAPDMPPAPPPMPPLDRAWEPLPGSLDLPLTALTEDTCKWMVGGSHTEKGHGFCGLPVAPGRSYCPQHQATSVGKGTPSERKAIEEAKRAVRMAA